MISYRASAGKRYIEGIAVPWDREIRISGRTESFAPGSLVLSDDPVPLRYGHQRDLEEGSPIPIGRIVAATDTADGLWVRAELFDSSTAQDALAAVQGGVVRGFSAEFVTRVASNKSRGPGAQGRVAEAELVGLVLTEKPAYPSAEVMNVRARTPVRDRWELWRSERRAAVGNISQEGDTP